MAPTHARYDSLLSIFTLLIMYFLSNESPTLPEYYHTYPRMGVIIVFVGRRAQLWLQGSAKHSICLHSQGRP